MFMGREKELHKLNTMFEMLSLLSNEAKLFMVIYIITVLY